MLEQLRVKSAVTPTDSDARAVATSRAPPTHDGSEFKMRTLVATGPGEMNRNNHIQQHKHHDQHNHIDCIFDVN